jgi:hypothetical protein
MTVSDHIFQAINYNKNVTKNPFINYIYGFL